MDKYIEKIHRVRYEHEEEMHGKSWGEWKESVLAEAEAFLGQKITLQAGEQPPKHIESPISVGTHEPNLSEETGERWKSNY